MNPRPRGALIAVAIVASVLLCGCGGLWAAYALSSDDPAPAEVACATQPGDTYGYCDRLDEIEVGRRALNAEQWAAASAVARSIRETLAGAPADARPNGIARILLDAGYSGAVVRKARENDPAPPGSIAYGVPAGAACVIGYRTPDASANIPAGPLPTQTCLLP
ncbi:hypothetical protein [Micromonospora sp. CPCC 206061]|uniref:hypothetical protein n=1 Tax=Micromonospora sp. CPCC 206061 TaxID=3122410 RepID=UPI002FF302F1